jgi:thioredoxin-related protein
MQHRRVLFWPLFVGTAVFMTTSAAVADEIRWRHDYNAARREAQEKGLPLVLDFGTEACVWCKKLDESTFRNPKIVNILNQQFVAVKLDAEKNAHLTETLQIQSFPTLILAAPDGKILQAQEGFVDAGQLSDQLEKVLAALGRDRHHAPAIELQGTHNADRSRRARELLAQAREDFRHQQYLCCLDRCETLVSAYRDFPEAAEASQLLGQIKHDPEGMQKACNTMAERLALMYLSLAEAWLNKGHPEQAILYFHRVLQTLPGSRYAETAQARLIQIQGQPAGATNFKRP